MPKKRNSVAGVSADRLGRRVIKGEVQDSPLVRTRKSIARNAAIDIVVRRKVCTCTKLGKKHAKDCDLIQPDREIARGQSVFMQMIVNHVEPKHGDIVVLVIKDVVPERQLRLFRRTAYALSQDHFEKTGIYMQYLIINADAEVHLMTKAGMQDVLHENKVITAEDGGLIETMRLIDDSDDDSD